MQTNKDPILYVVNDEGNIKSVQLSAKLWDKVESHVKSVAQSMQTGADPFLKPEPLEDLNELKKYWDFTYPYDPYVHCEACGVESKDWENDPVHPFHLTNANIGGLLVFQCRCGATIRKKHFHRKTVFECSAKNV